MKQTTQIEIPIMICKDCNKLKCLCKEKEEFLKQIYNPITGDYEFDTDKITKTLEMIEENYFEGLLTKEELEEQRQALLMETEMEINKRNKQLNEALDILDEEFRNGDMTGSEYKAQIDAILHETKGGKIIRKQNNIELLKHLKGDGLQTSDRVYDMLMDMCVLTIEHAEETRHVKDGIQISIWDNGKYLGELIKDGKVEKYIDIKEAVERIEELREQEDGFEYYLENVNIDKIIQLMMTEDEYKQESHYLSDQVSFKESMEYKLEKEMIDKEEYYNELEKTWHSESGLQRVKELKYGVEI